MLYYLLLGVLFYVANMFHTICRRISYRKDLWSDASITHFVLGAVFTTIAYPAIILRYILYKKEL